MESREISIQERTENFAIRVIKSYSVLNTRKFDDAKKILGKQFLRSGTSVGANCAEAVYAQSRNDFISKYSIALKPAFLTKIPIEIPENLTSSRFKPDLLPVQNLTGCWIELSSANYSK